MSALNPQTWLETGFTWERTADGSPTLRVNGGGESMHHSGGAFSETDLIYGSAVREAFASSVVTPRVLSVGLGLGYVELMTAAASIHTGKSFEMRSLESVEALCIAVRNWVLGHLEAGEIKTGLDEVAELVARDQKLEAGQLLQVLRKALQEDRWIIGGVLSSERPVGERFHAILYDVFAAKTYPDLWTEEHLERFLQVTAQEICVFSTFACTGNLKRALRKTGFEFIKRDGFKGTRNSTLGRKG